MGKGRTALAALAAIAILLVPATWAGAGPTAKPAGEELVAYATGGKLKVRKKIRYIVVCGAPVGSFCEIRTESKLKGKGSSTGRIVLSAVAAAGQGVEVVLKVSKRMRAALRAKIGKAKLVTKVISTNLTTGEVDTDSKRFKFKK